MPGVDTLCYQKETSSLTSGRFTAPWLALLLGMGVCAAAHGGFPTVLQRTLTDSDTEAGDYFGGDVALVSATGLQLTRTNLLRISAYRADRSEP